MRLAAIQLIPAQHDPIKDTFDSKRGKCLMHYNFLPLPFLYLYQLKSSPIYCFTRMTFLYNNERTELN